MNHNQYHAASMNMRVVRDLPLADAQFAANVELPKHSHRNPGYCLVLNGEYKESYGRTVLELKPSRVKFQPAGEPHTDVYGRKRVHCFIVELEPEWLARMNAADFVGNDPMAHCESDVSWTMLKLRKEFRLMNEASPLVIESLVLDLIAQTYRNPKRFPHDSQPSWLRQAREFIDDQLSQPLSLSAIAKSVSVHPVYLASSFRKSYGCTVGDYLRRRRIEFACNQILTSKASLADVALDAGFANQSHFSRTFRQVTGMTPGEYRNVGRQ